MKQLTRVVAAWWTGIGAGLQRTVTVALVLSLGVAIGVGFGDRGRPAGGPAPVTRIEAPLAHIPIPAPAATAPIIAREVPPAAVEGREAMLPPQRPEAPAPLGEAAWLRFAVPPPALDGRAMVAIVIDDVGLDRKRAERTIRLPGPLTLSFMTYAEELPRQTVAARAAGHELMLHVPMEPMDARADPGPNALLTGLDPEEVLRRLRWGLERFPGYVGVNNHMGSRFTSDPAAMITVITELRERGLLFLDSRTSANSTGEKLSRQLGVPHATRDIFLDNENAAPAIGARLADLEQVAHRKGTAIAIGHPHDATIAALAEWLTTLPEKGLVLVPLSAIVRRNTATGLTGTMPRSPG